MLRKVGLFFAVGSLAVALFASPLNSRADAPEPKLRDTYRGNVFILRGFYSGKELRYDAAGKLVGGGIPGDWMSDGFVQVKEIHASHRGLTIEGERLLVFQPNGKGFSFLRDGIIEDDKYPVKINVDLGQSDPLPQQIESALAGIFLTANDSLADFVPNYWKPCVRAPADASDDYGFSSQVLKVPGVAVVPTTHSATTSEESEVLACNSPPLRNNGKTYPLITHQEDPEFTDRARKQRKQGVVTMKLVVNAEGVPQDVRVITPVGYGLDEKALICVRKWRFRPVEKDGQPIAMEIVVQVQFHLY